MQKKTYRVSFMNISYLYRVCSLNNYINTTNISSIAEEWWQGKRKRSGIGGESKFGIPASRSSAISRNLDKLTNWFISEIYIHFYFRFHNNFPSFRSELDKMPNNSICDVIGVLVFVGRVQRSKKKGKLLILKVIKCISVNNSVFICA